MNRRNFLQTTTTTALGIAAVPALASSPAPLRVACQQYTWFTFFKREGIQWGADMPACLQAVKKAGFDGFEPIYESPQQVQQWQPHLQQHQVWTSSMYVNSLLHQAEKIADSIQEVLEIARLAYGQGVRMVVTNPSPISWGSKENKTDAQLILQARALNELGQKLRQMGMTLAYHNHDAEMRQSAREFHHMMQGTDPANVKLCLDAHWIYRGAGNSQVALFDILKMYAQRIVELHLRQSQAGVWSEVWGEGDLDYPRLADELLKRKLKPQLVLEQAVEEGTPHTLDAIAAQRKSLEHVRAVFANFG